MNREAAGRLHPKNSLLKEASCLPSSKHHKLKGKNKIPRMCHLSLSYCTSTVHSPHTRRSNVLKLKAMSSSETLQGLPSGNQIKSKNVGFPCSNRSLLVWSHARPNLHSQHSRLLPIAQLTFTATAPHKHSTNTPASSLCL